MCSKVAAFLCTRVHSCDHSCPARIPQRSLRPGPAPSSRLPLLMSETTEPDFFPQLEGDPAAPGACKEPGCPRELSPQHWRPRDPAPQLRGAATDEHTQASRHLCFTARLETDRWVHLRTAHGPQGTRV